MSRHSDFRFNAFFILFFFNQALMKGVTVFLWLLITSWVEVMRGTVEGAEPGSLMGGGVKV